MSPLQHFPGHNGDSSFGIADDNSIDCSTRNIEVPPSQLEHCWDLTGIIVKAFFFASHDAHVRKCICLPIYIDLTLARLTFGIEFTKNCFVIERLPLVGTYLSSPSKYFLVVLDRKKEGKRAMHVHRRRKGLLLRWIWVLECRARRSNSFLFRIFFLDITRGTLLPIKAIFCLVFNVGDEGHLL